MIIIAMVVRMSAAQKSQEPESGNVLSLRTYKKVKTSVRLATDIAVTIQFWVILETNN
jgi:hypothetical protein